MSHCMRLLGHALDLADRVYIATHRCEVNPERLYQRGRHIYSKCIDCGTEMRVGRAPVGSEEG